MGKLVLNDLGNFKGADLWRYLVLTSTSYDLTSKTQTKCLKTAEKQEVFATFFVLGLISRTQLVVLLPDDMKIVLPNKRIRPKFTGCVPGKLIISTQVCFFFFSSPACQSHETAILLCLCFVAAFFFSTSRTKMPFEP